MGEAKAKATGEREAREVPRDRDRTDDGQVLQARRQGGEGGGQARAEEEVGGTPARFAPPPPLSLSPLSISSLETRSRAFLLLSVLADTTLTRPRRQTSPGVSWPGSFCRPASSSPRGFRSWYASLYPSRASRSSSERSPTRTSLLTSFVGFCLPRSASRASEGP